MLLSVLLRDKRASSSLWSARQQTTPDNTLTTNALSAVPTNHKQGDLFKPNHYYLSLHAFRELTLKRLVAFVGAKFRDGSGNTPRGFDVRDYLNGQW